MAFVLLAHVLILLLTDAKPWRVVAALLLVLGWVLISWKG
jgi:hypothetical protein